uniref:CDP-diacylglycerol--inositol 3-phosphatidyltransferase n=1 Tax=Parastrongyloides trichosuri TaxID=131310 RepID=A0A0N4ZN08_PARTI
MITSKDVFLYYPNLLGYGRIILGILSFMTMRHCPLTTAILYGTSGFLDALDGHLARTYNQSSRFGAMLDQLTDRCTFMALLICLSVFYPSFTFIFQMIAIIDIASHWLHLHATDLTGKNTHKSSDNPILNLYYTSKPVLFFMCLGNEAFFGLLYLLNFYTGPTLLSISLLKVITVLMFPVAAVKIGISIIHLITASQTITEFDANNANKLISNNDVNKKGH